MLDVGLPAIATLKSRATYTTCLFSLPVPTFYQKLPVISSSFCRLEFQGLFLQQPNLGMCFYDKSKCLKLGVKTKKMQWLRRSAHILPHNCLHGLRIFSKWKWWKKEKESILHDENPLPLPMTYPDSTPLAKEEIEKMANCNPQMEDCKEVVYQWTGECRRCQGTGLVSFYRKNGHEVISKCILCLGIVARWPRTKGPLFPHPQQVEQ
ncbi:hypothetical protein O6H91_19G050200 [Diphasiastrum complanatum]|uniref:Uncharacterized protein n=1 Tax=Diphasiastrum complanatum TaxID=34168 RepID=A0ACC2AV20_DIPCM|nr:hypothetical protein O6H91_19G050200 [Diphasiastrum complanatum]